MVVIEQSAKWVQYVLGINLIEQAGRTCYKSEDKITADSAQKFIEMIMKRGHLSVIEHVSASVRFITNRGVTHELVRHRLASYSQESTRYVNYSKEKHGGSQITFIQPHWMDTTKDADGTDPKILAWINAMASSEKAYNKLIKEGLPPQDARGVLPIDLKTEIVMTANLREWMHVFKLRCSKAAHPQMRALMIPTLKMFQAAYPLIFDKIQEAD